ncbi:MAG: SurA N-terminal domain-containing protein, partial [Planctomycetota bacterium]
MGSILRATSCGCMLFQALLARRCLCASIASPPVRFQEDAVRSRDAVVFKGGSVLRDEYHLELARRHRGKPLGKEALDHLVEKRIVELEAKARKVDFSDAEIDARIQFIRRQLEASEQSLDSLIRSKGMTRTEFRNYVKLSLLHEHLARKDLALGPEERLDPAQQRLWVDGLRRAHRLVTDPAKLPAGVCARVDGEELSLRKLGQVMDANLAPEDRRAILQQMVAYRLLQAECAKRELSVTKALVEAEIQERRKAFRKNRSFEGLSFEDLLRAQGRTLDDLKRGEAFQAQLLVALLGEALHPAKAIREDFDKNPRQWHGRVGVSRHGFRIFVRAKPERSPEEARALCEKLAKRARDLGSFQALARSYSEDVASRARGGDLGFLHREHPRHGKALLKALFALPIGKVSAPVEDRVGDKQGYSLLFLTELKPAPTGEALERAIRRWKMTKYLEQLL